MKTLRVKIGSQNCRITDALRSMIIDVALIRADEEPKIIEKVQFRELTPGGLKND